MKLQEILRTQVAVDKKPEDALKNLDNLQFVKKLTSTLSLFRDKNKFALKRGAEFIGVIEFEDNLTNIHGVQYFVINKIYIAPEHRGRTGGIFLLSFKNELKHPFIIGTQDKQGGVLFKDGVKLVNAMNKSNKFEVSVLDFKTGNSRDYDPSEILGTGVTLVIESDSRPFPWFSKTWGVYIFEGCEDRGGI